MPRPAATAVVLLVCAIATPRGAQRTPAPGLYDLTLPARVTDVAAAAGLQRADAATFPIDIVRFAFASPDGSNEGEMAARASLRAALEQGGTGDAIPLPLSPGTWRTYILHTQAADARLAAVIFGQRRTALLYHALLGLDAETLQWLEAHPETIEPFLKYAGAASVYARSIHISRGIVATPGESAADVWTVLVGADPAQPAAFIGKLLSVRGGRVAAFYDAIAHADPAHQTFMLGRPGDRARVDRAWRAMEVVVKAPAAWSIEEHPFLRRDVDFSVVLRSISVDETGRLRPPAAKALWARVFREGPATEGDVDAEWLTRAILDLPAAAARRRLDTFAFAQRAFGDARATDALESVLQQHPRFVALLSVLTSNGVTDPGACAAAIQVAGALERDQDAMIVFQSALAILDRAAAAGTLEPAAVRAAMGSLMNAAAVKPAPASLLAWIEKDLPLVLAPARSGSERGDLEHIVLAALAGPVSKPSIPVRWEGQAYVADLSRTELRRLTQVRQSQEEPPLDAALAAARSRGLAPIADSLAGLVYAAAMGEFESRQVNGGPVWRRHRFGGDGAGQEPNAAAWRVATEVFGSGGWHLNGSLLYLHVALAHLSLRRLDDSEVPAASRLSTNDRRTLAMSVALMNPRLVTDDERDAITAAMTRGRERIAAAATNPADAGSLASAAGVGEWRLNSIRWLAANRSDVPGAFTILEIYRAGGGERLDTWGAASAPIDGCLCLRMPQGAWDDATGRPSAGQLGTHFADVMLRTAEILAARKLPALLARDVAAFATRDTLDRSNPAWAGDWLTLAFTARDIANDRFDDYIGALTAAGPLLPAPRGSQ